MNANQVPTNGTTTQFNTATAAIQDAQNNLVTVADATTTATTAVELATDTLTRANFDLATDAVEELPTGNDRTNLENRLAALESPTVTTASELTSALVGEVARDITITPVTPLAGDFVVTNDDVTINGNNAQIFGSLIVVGDNVTINDLNVDALSSPTAHGIQVFDANATFNNVNVTNSSKNGIYINNKSGEDVVVAFNDVTTSGNAWAGIGLVSQVVDGSVVANFTGVNQFGEEVITDGTVSRVGVYSEQGTSADPTLYAGDVDVNGLSEVEHPNSSNAPYQTGYTTVNSNL